MKRLYKYISVSLLILGFPFYLDTYLKALGLLGFIPYSETRTDLLVGLTALQIFWGIVYLVSCGNSIDGRDY